jgi:hypothetical protein
LYAALRLHFADRKRGIDVSRDESLLVPMSTGPAPIDWDAATGISTRPDQLTSEPVVPGSHAPVPPAALKPKSYDQWTKEVVRRVVQSETLEIFESSRHGVVSTPGESERDFRIRLQTLARERRDAAIDKVRQKYATKHASLTEQIRKAEQSLGRESDQAREQKVQTAVSFGATVIGVLLGRKTISTSTLGRATTAARSAGRTARQAQDVERATETLAARRAQLEDLEARIKTEADTAAATVDPATERLETVVVKPKRTDVTVEAVVLVWKAS